MRILLNFSSNSINGSNGSYSGSQNRNIFAVGGIIPVEWWKPNICSKYLMYHQLVEKKFFAAQKLGNRQLSNIHVSSLLELSTTDIQWTQTTEVSLTIIIHTDIWQKTHKTSFSESFTFKWQAFFLHGFNHASFKFFLETCRVSLEFMYCSSYPLRTSQGCQQFPTCQSKSATWVLKKKFAFKHSLDLENKHPEIMICQETIFQIFWTGQKKTETQHRSLVYDTDWLNNQGSLLLALNVAT